jgi:hypothetical protein
MDLLKDELGSSTETCVTSTFDGNEVTRIKTKRSTGITEEEDREPRTIPVIKMEPRSDYTRSRIHTIVLLRMST